MLHEMKLNPEPFAMIESGEKTIELRLYDEKRRGISAGDEIVFSNSALPERKLSAKVKALHIFDSFKQLYDVLPLRKCGYTAEDIASATYEDMNVYYSPDMQLQFGVVGIELENVKTI